MPLTSTFWNEYQGAPQEWRIEIHDLSGGNLDGTFTAGSGGFSLNYRGEGTGPEVPMLTSELRFQMLCDAGIHTGFITSLATSPENRFCVRVYRGNSLFWAGLALPQNARLDYDSVPFFWFDCSAVDGLALLKDYEYTGAEDTIFTDRASFGVHFRDCLRKIPYVASVWSGSSVFFRALTRWLSDQHEGTDDLISHTYVNRRVWFSTDSRGQRQNTSCWEVLRNIAVCMGARLWQTGGSWLFEQIDARIGTGQMRNYDYDMLPSGTSGYAPRIVACGNPNEQTHRVPGNYSDWMPGLRLATYAWTARQSRNLIAGYAPSSGTPVGTTVAAGSIDHSVAGQVSFRLSFRISVTIYNQSITPGATGWAAFRFLLKVGNRWLTRYYNVVNGVPQPGATSWGGVENYYYFGTPVFQFPATGVSTYASVNLSIETPRLPAGTGDFEFRIEYLYVNVAGNQNTSSNLITSFNTYNAECYLLYGGTPINSAQELEYTEQNSVTGFSGEVKIHTLLASRETANDLGGLFAGLGQGSPCVNWGLATSNPKNSPLQRWWGARMQAMRGKHCQRLYGDFYTAFFEVEKSLFLDDGTWVFMAGTYTGGRDRLNGEWMQIAGGNGSISRPTLRIDTGPFLSPNGTIVRNIGTGGGDSGFPVTGGGTTLSGLDLLGLLAVGHTAELLTAGSVTYVPLKETFRAGMFRAGDRVIIVNHVTGMNQMLTVAEDAPAGASGISVDTNTLLNDYPEDSLILYPLTNYAQTSAARWRHWNGTISGTGRLPLPGTHVLPTDPEAILITVEGVTYDPVSGSPTYSIDVPGNAVVFSDSSLADLRAVVRQLF